MNGVIHEALLLLRAESSVHVGVEAPVVAHALERLDALCDLVADGKPWPPNREYVKGLLS